MIEASKLTKTYGAHRGIVDVDLRVVPGEVVGLVGANGAGKTTLMRTLLDFVRPTSGSLRVFGLDSVTKSVEVRREVSYLPGELVIPARLTGHAAIQRFMFARPEVPAARIDAVARRLDLDLSRRVGDLSKGNKQKLGLVLAFAPTVRLLVLDEPTSGLDPLLQREFAAMAREVVADGRTVLLSSHVMSEVEQVADRVALLRDGRLTAFDAISTVLARARRRGRARPVHPEETESLAEALRRTEGISEVHLGESRSDQGVAVEFACTGSVDPLVRTLSGFRLATLDLAHADLEDAFFSVYPASG